MNMTQNLGSDLVDTGIEAEKFSTALDVASMNSSSVGFFGFVLLCITEGSDPRIKGFAQLY